MKLSSTFRSISSAFAIEFDELCREISHNQTSGEAREYALVSLLRKYLPLRVGIERGFVIDARGGESKQIDVVIYDKTVGTVFEVSGVKYFPCETVIAVGEVKSDIDSSTKLLDALNKLRSVKSLDRTNNGTNKLITGPGLSINGIRFDPSTIHRDQIFGFIFTSSSMLKETLISHIQQYNASNPRQQWMNLFCDCRNFLISYERPGALYPSAMDATYLYCTEEIEKPDLLLLFYCILANFVDEAHVARPNYFAYGSISETKASFHELFPKREDNTE
jgi:hypothetical protein